MSNLQCFDTNVGILGRTDWGSYTNVMNPDALQRQVPVALDPTVIKYDKTSQNANRCLAGKVTRL